jgi:hypothetical protein
VKALPSPNNRIRGLFLSTSPQHVCGGVQTRRGPVYQVHGHLCNHGLEHHTSVSSRLCRYVTRPRPTQHFSPITAQNTSASGVHITTTGVARSFVVLCASHAAKIANYSTTSERSSLKQCIVCVKYGDFNRRAANSCCSHDMDHLHPMNIPHIDDLRIPFWWGRQKLYAYKSCGIFVAVNDKICFNSIQFNLFSSIKSITSSRELLDIELVITIYIYIHIYTCTDDYA